MRDLIGILKHLVRRAGGTRAGLYPLETLKNLVRQLERTREVEYACEEVHRLLDQFAEAVIRGEDASRLMPLVEQHLEMCPDCREEYEALIRILTLSPA